MDNLVDETRRQQRKRTFEPLTCPVCGITIRESELDQHFKTELEKLEKIRKVVNSRSQTPPSTSSITKQDKAGQSSNSVKVDADENCWDTFQKIKENRVRRSSKVRNKLFF